MKLYFVYFEKWSWHQNESFCSYAFFKHPNIEKSNQEDKTLIIRVRVRL